MELAFYSRDGCHLCDRLEAMIQPHLQRLRQAGPAALIQRNIDDAADWYDAYHDRIPVVTCDGAVILEGRPDECQVAAAFARLRP